MRSLALSLGAAALLATASGCGSADGGAGPSRDAYVALVDVSYSTAKARAEYEPDLLKVAGQAADAQAPLYADAFDGDPSARIRWRVRGRFDAPPPDVYKGNKELTKRYRAKQAQTLQPQLKGLLRERAQTSGSPLGPALEAAAGACEQQQPRACKVYVFTDGVFIGKDFNARTGDAAARHRLVAHWADRIRGLDGAEVTFVGVGFGTRATESTRKNSQMAAEDLLSAAGATLAGWNVTLA
jgi:hypothetical protein